MEYKLSIRVNVYETLHSLYTKRCSLAVYERPVYERLLTRSEPISLPISKVSLPPVGRVAFGDSERIPAKCPVRKDRLEFCEHVRKHER